MKRKKINLDELSDKDLIDYYHKLKKRHIVTNFVSPLGAMTIGITTSRHPVAFASALTAYVVLGGVFVGKTVSNLSKAREELYNRDSTRRLLFENMKKSGLSKREIKEFKEVLEKAIHYKNLINEKYSLLELQNDLLLFDDKANNLFESIKKNEEERKSLQKDAEKLDKLIDDYLFILSDHKDYLDTLKIPPRGVSGASYKANIRVVDKDTLFYQKGLSVEDFDDVLSEFDKNIENNEKRQNQTHSEDEKC